MSKMDQALKAKWVEALRSGKYRQGTNVMRSFSDEYCCLGVLCEVSGIAKFDGTGYSYDDDYGTSWLPITLEKKLGVPYALQCDLAKMNDGEGRPFSEIADYIEANL